jgi:hypothetical protein
MLEASALRPWSLTTIWRAHTEEFTGPNPVSPASITPWSQPVTRVVLSSSCRVSHVRPVLGWTGNLLQSLASYGLVIHELTGLDDTNATVVRIVWPDAPTITTPARYNEVPAQPCGCSMRHPRPWPESERANGCDGADRLRRPHRWCWLTAFGRLTSAAYQPSGGPLPQYPSSCPRWSCMESA